MTVNNQKRKHESKRFRFSQKALAAVTCPPSGRPDRSGRVWVQDEEVKGLACCVTEAGARTFYLVKWVGNRTLRVRLGTAEEMTISQARDAAVAMKDDVRNGVDPQAEKIANRAEATFGDLWESYMEGHAKPHKKPSSVKEDKRLYEQHLKHWAPRKAADITAADVDTLKTRVGKKSQVTANHLLSLLSCMYRKRGHFFGLARLFTPTAGLEKYKERPRDRVLSPEELVSVIAAIEADENETMKHVFLMCMYTGARRSNVAEMRWEDLKLYRGLWRIPGEVTKSGDKLTISLVPKAVDLLQKRSDHSPYVFPARRVTPEELTTARELHAQGVKGRKIARQLRLSQTQIRRMLDPGFAAPAPGPVNGLSKAWTRIVKRAGLTERTTIHDLRRTFCTNMVEAGAQLPHVAAAMGHKTLATTQKHYAIAREEKVREGVAAGVARMFEPVKTAAQGAAAANTPAA